MSASQSVHAPAPTRSQLFIPGPKAESWFDKGVAAGADAIIFDLEDATSPDEKAAARAIVADTVRHGRTQDHCPVLIVRVNDADTIEFLDDVVAVVDAGVDVVMLPKTRSARDVIALDGLISAVERRVGAQLGHTLITPLLETASALRTAYDIARASARVAYMGALSADGGDVEREVGFRWTPKGQETLAFRANVLLDARAAGVHNPVTGLWTSIDDLDGLCSFAQQSRDLGYEGMLVIHPSHVAVVNETFQSSPTQLDTDRRMVAALHDAMSRGSASIRFEGKMVDVAMLNSATKRIANASQQQM